MKYLLPVLLFSLLVIGCHDGDNVHLPAQKMEGVIMDLEMAEIYSTLVKKDTTIKPANAKNIDSLAYFHNEIFAHYNITVEQFQSSMKWYSFHPDELDSIYTHVSIKLTKLGAKYKVQ